MNKYFNNRLIVLLVILLFSNIGFAETFRELDKNEMQKLHKILTKTLLVEKRAPIDISCSKSVTYYANLVKSLEEDAKKRLKKFKEEGSPVTMIKSAGIAIDNGMELFLTDERMVWDGKKKYREDFVRFSDVDKENINYSYTGINNGKTHLKLDHKRFSATLNTVKKWAGSGGLALGYGTFLELKKASISRHILANTYSKKHQIQRFRHKGFTEIQGKKVDVIDCYDFEKQRPLYEIQLANDDWGRCYKLIEYGKQINQKKLVVEYLDFRIVNKKEKLSYPHLIIHRYFDDEGQPTKLEEVVVKKVSLGVTVPDKLFDIDDTKNYVVRDKR